VNQRVVKKYFKDDKLLVQIGDKIRKIRTERGISQEFLANECDVDYSQINRMELGKVNFRVSLLTKIASALKVHPQDLLS
jgi:transcriptional regulator with XRE-family HTH domain